MLIIGRRCGNVFFFFQAEDGIRDLTVTGVQTCALPIYKLPAGTQLWYGTVLPSPQTIDRLEIVDHDNDGRRDIAISTSTGHTFHLDFDGRIIATTHQIGRASCRERV